jgi:hypothetical protein
LLCYKKFSQKAKIFAPQSSQSAQRKSTGVAFVIFVPFVVQFWPRPSGLRLKPRYVFAI